MKIVIETMKQQMDTMNTQSEKFTNRGRTVRKAILTLTLASAALFATGCLNNEEEAPAPAKSELIVNQNQKLAFKEAHDLWKASKPASYSFQLNRNCFCFPFGWMEVYVDDDKVVKVEGVEGPYDFESLHRAPNIDDVFNQVEGFLNNPDYEVKASYNGKMGYPATVKIHHLLNYHDADAEFLIAGFRPE